MRRIRGREAALVGIAASLLAASGCDFFKPRDAIEGSGGGVWVPPTSPEIVIANLEAAFEAGIFADYRRAFTDEFRFEPDAVDVLQMAIERPGEPVYDAWTADVETQVAEAIETGTTSVDLVFVFLNEQILEEGRLHKYEYTLTITRAGRVDVYEGEAWFEIRQVAAGEWLIHHWADVVTPRTVESWGRLKGRNRQP